MLLATSEVLGRDVPLGWFREVRHWTLYRRCFFFISQMEYFFNVTYYSVGLKVFTQRLRVKLMDGKKYTTVTWVFLYSILRNQRFFHESQKYGQINCCLKSHFIYLSRFHECVSIASYFVLVLRGVQYHVCNCCNSPKECRVKVRCVKGKVSGAELKYEK